MIIAVNFPIYKQLERRSLKKSGLQRDSNPWPPRYRCDALPIELWSHTLEARSWVRIPLKPCFFLQASSSQLLKVENSLRWSLFTFIYSAVQIWIISYIRNAKLTTIADIIWFQFELRNRKHLGFLSCSCDASGNVRQLPSKDWLLSIVHRV